MPDNTFEIKITDTTPPGAPAPKSDLASFNFDEFRKLPAGDASVDQRAASRAIGNDALTSRLVDLYTADFKEGMQQLAKLKQDEIRLQEAEMEQGREVWRKGIEDLQARREAEAQLQQKEMQQAQELWRKGVEELQARRQAEARMQEAEMQQGRELWRKGVEERNRQLELSSPSRTAVGGAFARLGGQAGVGAEFAKANADMLKGIGMVTTALVAAGHLIADTLRLVAFRINKESEIAGAQIRGDIQSARVAELEKEKGTVAFGLKHGGTAAGAAIGGYFGSGAGPVGTVAGAGIGAGIGRLLGGVAAEISDAAYEIRIAARKEFENVRNAFRERGAQLAPYSPQLSQQLAIGEMNKQRRDIGQAAIVGGRFAELEERQQQLDLLEQQLATLKSLQRVGEQRERLDKQIAEIQAEVNKSMKNVDANTAKMVKDLQKQESPGDLLKKWKQGRVGSARAGGAGDMSGRALGIPVVTGKPLLEGN